MYPKNDEVKQEVVEMHEVQQRMNSNDDEDYMYMKVKNSLIFNVFLYS